MRRKRERERHTENRGQSNIEVKGSKKHTLITHRYQPTTMKISREENGKRYLHTIKKIGREENGKR